MDATLHGFLWRYLNPSVQSHPVPLLQHQNGMEFYSERARSDWLFYWHGQDRQGFQVYVSNYATAHGSFDLHSLVRAKGLDDRRFLHDRACCKSDRVSFPTAAYIGPVLDL